MCPLVKLGGDVPLPGKLRRLPPRKIRYVRGEIFKDRFKHFFACFTTYTLVKNKKTNLGNTLSTFHLQLVLTEKMDRIPCKKIQGGEIIQLFPPSPPLDTFTQTQLVVLPINSWTSLDQVNSCTGLDLVNSCTGLNLVNSCTGSDLVNSCTGLNLVNSCTGCRFNCLELSITWLN